ncbi:MAG TPA: hypothetical protein PLO53_06675, partial [Candidatus Hydrogenedentes bacterium]|nr:hypothetical protein [Candidatus Hydrogenedentota bacterium]
MKTGADRIQRINERRRQAGWRAPAWQGVGRAGYSVGPATHEGKSPMKKRAVILTVAVALGVLFSP